jgi:hypothetical protein
MLGPCLRTRLRIVLVHFAAGMSLALAAPPGRAASASQAGRSTEHSYQAALGALWNYQSCGVRARPAAYEALSARLRSLEAIARAKGLGPTLERVRREYNNILAVSTRTACSGGPVAALTRARRAMAAFQSWVDGARVQALTRRK